MTNYAKADGSDRWSKECARGSVEHQGSENHRKVRPNSYSVTWCRDEVLRRVLMDVANELRDKGALDEAECFIDATFVMAKGGGAEASR
jgi:hypothetical protein